MSATRAAAVQGVETEFIPRPSREGSLVGGYGDHSGVVRELGRVLGVKSLLSILEISHRIG